MIKKNMIQKTLVLKLLIFLVESTPRHLIHLKKLLWCDSLTNITERSIEACATLEMEERKLGTTSMDARYNSLREIWFSPKHESKDAF